MAGDDTGGRGKPRRDPNPDEQRASVLTVLRLGDGDPEGTLLVLEELGLRGLAEEMHEELRVRASHVEARQTGDPT